MGRNAIPAALTLSGPKMGQPVYPTGVVVDRNYPLRAQTCPLDLHSSVRKCAGEDTSPTSVPLPRLDKPDLARASRADRIRLITRLANRMDEHAQQAQPSPQDRNGKSF